jgi:hypothetical protein
VNEFNLLRIAESGIALKARFADISNPARPFGEGISGEESRSRDTTLSAVTSSPVRFGKKRGLFSGGALEPSKEKPGVTSRASQIYEAKRR